MPWFRRLLALPQRLLFTAGFLLWEWTYVLLKRPALLPHLWRLWEWSLFHSPYRAARRTTTPSNLDLTYGELALPTVDAIFDRLRLSSDDLLLDLGSGRGRVVLLAATRGIPAVGIELVEGLLETARYAAGPHLPLATFRHDNFLDADLQPATVLWAVGTCWSDDTRDQLLQRILTLRPGTWIVSVTIPFLHPRLPVRDQLRGWTSWGRDRYYLQQLL